MKHFKCAYCLNDFPGPVKYSIHRDGLGEGPDVPLCGDCGGTSSPTCEEIWTRLAERRPAAVSYYDGEKEKPVTKSKSEYWR